ncbi:hypothetical protein GCM10018962_77250 [Dactylosporangium matsuzakiense]|uniref:helix-turn-helix domain-containing protein n=1 Tax=Dactylosporangium matsuzakiense TaxID=53360 RepID=UPI0031EE5BB5
MADGPVTDAERDRVAELHAEGKSRAQIARELGRSPNTIGRIAAALGLSWDRTGTAEATRARQVDLAARRAELARLLLEDAFRIRGRFFTEYTEQRAVGSPDGVEVVTIVHSEPPAAELRNLVTSVAVVVDKHLALVKVDVDSTGKAAVDAWLADMLGGAAGSAAEQAGPPV